MSGEWARWEQLKLMGSLGTRRDVPRAGCNWRTELTGEGEEVRGVSDQLDHPALRDSDFLSPSMYFTGLENCSGEGRTQSDASVPYIASRMLQGSWAFHASNVRAYLRGDL